MTPNISDLRQLLSTIQWACDGQCPNCRSWNYPTHESDCEIPFWITTLKAWESNPTIREDVAAIARATGEQP